jgi:hypothetical protein
MNGILPQSPSLRIFLALGGGILALLICLLCALVVPGVISPPTPTLAAVAQAPTATGTPTGTPTGTLTGTATRMATGTATPLPSNTATSLPCVPNAVFAADVTIPNGSPMAPGTPFVKTWRVKNSGNCTWDNSYAIVFVGGIAMGPGTAPVPFAGPGAVVDISLPMTAPAAPGTYSGIWRLRAPSGALFGINLSTLIEVLKATTSTPTSTPTATPTRPPLLDFVKQAPNAEWSSAEASLPWNGSTGDSSGFVVPLQGNTAVEDGTVPQLALETHPQWVTQGYVEGFYSKFPLAIRKGDQLHVKIGFVQGAGAGDVTFNVAYDSCGDGCWTDLLNIQHAYSGTLVEQIVDISSILTRLSTRTTTFRLRVSANNQDAGQDWATWVIAQIERPQP